MRRFGTSAVLGATLLLLGTASAEDPAKEKEALKDTKEERDKQLKSLEGSWHIVGMRQAGKDVPDEALPAVRLHYLFKSDGTLLAAERWWLRGSFQAIFKLDIEDNRWVINVIDGKNHVERGIYKVERQRWYTPSETLVLCFAPPGQERPTSIGSTKSDGNIVLQLRRDLSPPPAPPVEEVPK